MPIASGLGFGAPQSSVSPMVESLISRYRPGHATEEKMAGLFILYLPASVKSTISAYIGETWLQQLQP